LPSDGAGRGGAAVWPLVARAQQGDRVRRIGVLLSGDENDPLAPPDAWRNRISISIRFVVRVDSRWLTNQYSMLF
jgi:hypothetical protein